MIQAQPEPIGLRIEWFRLAGGHDATVIARSWAEDQPEGCGLCPGRQCQASGGLCMIVAPGIVAPEDAALYAMPE